MDAEMIERCAEAIYNVWNNYPACSVSKPWKELCEVLPGQADSFRRYAKANIKAMREPTEKMIEAGACVSTQMVNDCKGNHEIDKAVYQAMIDAVINERN